MLEVTDELICENTVTTAAAAAITADELIELLIEYLEREDMSKRDFAERLEELMRV